MKYLEYRRVITDQLDRQFDEEGAAIEKAAEYCAASVCSGRLIHVFGCGHSQMFAMEVFYRAGGLVPVNALAIPALIGLGIRRLSMGPTALARAKKVVCGLELAEAEKLATRVCSLATNDEVRAALESFAAEGKVV